MTVVIPEKTIEHWASIYLANRYASRGVQWWSPKRPDITVAMKSLGYGKLIWLEIKTATWTGASPRTGRQHIEIDLDQLAIYVARTIPTYYVLPAPFWKGAVSAEARAIHATGSSVLDLGFRRSGPYWFGNWTWVISAADLLGALAIRRLATAVAGHVRPKGYLLSPPPGAGGRYGGGGALPGMVPWTDFWDRMDLCGAGGLNSLLVSDQPPEDLVLNENAFRQLIQRLGRENPVFDPRAHLLTQQENTWTLTHIDDPLGDIAQQDAPSLSPRGWVCCTDR